MHEKLQKSPDTPAVDPVRIPTSRDFSNGVDVTGVYKSFGSQIVLKDINFSLAGGQGLCVCGANAAGKTTLLRLIAGLLQPDAGEVRICGFDLKNHPQQAKANLGVIFHKSMVYPQLTTLENLQFFAKLNGVKDNKALIQRLLEQAGLLPYRYDKVGVLSRGMMQRLSIARAFVNSPSVLLADEPFTGLDADASKQLVAILHKFKDDGGTIIMATHNVNLSFQCCEQIAVLDEQKFIFNAKVCEIDTAAFAKDYLSYARINTWVTSQTQ